MKKKSTSIIQRDRRRRRKKIKNRRRDMCTSHEPMPEIPFELVIEILTRLPAKSLMKFKSVSKIWSSLICSPFLRVASSQPRLYLSLGFFDNSHQKSMVLSASPSSDYDGATMSSFDAYQDLTIPAMRGYASDIFHGLMCFINGSSVQIYNTTTRQLVVLPDIKESKLIPEDPKSMSIMCHVGHDPVHNQYKVVCIASRVTDEDTILSEHWVFLLERDGSSRWKKISCGYPPHGPLTRALNINGRMHYLAAVSMVDVLIMTFDFHSEKISVLQLPKDIFWYEVDLIEYGGKIALLRNPTNIETQILGVIEVWVMKDEETNMWENKKLVLHPSQKHMVNDMSLKVQGTTPNGEIILVPRFTNPFNIFLYDIQKNHMRKIEIKATPNHHLIKSCEVVGIDDVENLRHF